MKKLIAFTSAAVASSALFATAPVVSDVTMTQALDRTVTITYTLSGEPGIVTVDVQTNRGDDVWVSIGGKHLTHFAGDVNKKVGTGPHTMTWLPVKAWPDNEVKENVKAVVSAWALDVPPDYMVASLTVPSNVFFYVDAEAIPFGVTHDMYKTDYLVMRKCPAANVTWRMGSPTTENGRDKNAETPHLVTLTNDYYIGVYPVTQRQWELVKGNRPSYYKLDTDYATRPVEMVSFEAVRGTAKSGYSWPANGHAVLGSSFMGKLRDFIGLDEFDLPTDAQWEFACRAGCGSALYNGTELEDTTTSENVNRLARYANNGGTPGGVLPPAASTSENGTAKVGSYEPNAWGLYDMLGNVWEWCLDFYSVSPIGFDPETGPAQTDPSLADWGTFRVTRGGTWNNAASHCRCAKRNGVTHESVQYVIGLRVAYPARVP